MLLSIQTPLLNDQNSILLLHIFPNQAVTFFNCILGGGGGGGGGVVEFLLLLVLFMCVVFCSRK